MGYYTDFTLTIEGPNPHADMSPIIDHLRESNENAQYAFSDTGLSSGNELKWYNYEKDMTAFSKLYPHLVFHLYGEGEGHGDGPDVWWMHFQNGEVQECKAIITFEPCKFKPAPGPDPVKDPIRAYEAEHGPLSKLPSHVAELVKKGLLAP